jgi:large subunit ribosomal protein L30
MGQLKITQVRSSSRREASQGRTLVALGIRKNQHSVVKDDSPQIRGMINKVRHLVKVEEVK